MRQTLLALSSVFLWLAAPTWASEPAPPSLPGASALAPTPVPPSEPMPTGLPTLGALGVLGLLGTLAFVLRRRVQAQPHHLAVVETLGVGPKRALVLARVGDELVLLGSSDAGLTLLVPRVNVSLTSPLPEPASTQPAPPPGGGAWWKRLHEPHAAPSATDFASLLQESAEDLDLRRKLARGMAGRVQP